jgi:phenylpropionate dioxygenase-like ring-hydroxylating dioxygenase large terminal subunit
MSLVDERADAFRVSRRIYSDRDVHAAELERIFRHCWLFVAHESEIPEPGDYVTRVLGVDPVIVVRDERGDVQVLHNACRHRGVKLCRAAMGNASHFRCSYHGWTYANQRRTAPRRDLPEGGLRRRLRQVGPRPVPRRASRRRPRPDLRHLGP